MRLKRTRRGKTFVDITPVYGKLRITMGNNDGGGNKNTDLDLYELDQMITMLAYYKLELEGKLASTEEDASTKFVGSLILSGGFPEFDSPEFEKMCPATEWVVARCQGLCDWGQSHVEGRNLDIFGKVEDTGDWYHWHRGESYGKWVRSVDPNTIPNTEINKYF